MRARGESIDGLGERRLLPLVLATALPLAVVAAAYALWWISDRLLDVGPLHRAAFGWMVVVPVWLAAPVAAGFAWSRLPPRSSQLAALVVGTAVAGVATILAWQAVASPSCEFGAIRTAGDWVASSLLVGVVIGGGLAVSGLLADRLVRGGHPWRAMALGAGAGVGMVFVAIVVAGAMLLVPACQRPPI